jgi:hypothetical protein
VQVWAANISLLTSHFCPDFSHFAQPKDTPFRLLGFTQIPTLQHELKINSTRVPIQNPYLSFYMPLSLLFGLPFFCHQSSTSTPYKIYFYQGHIACHSVINGTTEIKYNNNYSQQVKLTIS